MIVKPDAGPIAGVASANLTDTAYQRIRHAITRCLILPGSQVSEPQLADRYAIGRGPVRMALSRLTQEGLVQPVPRQGYRVAPVTLEDIEELTATWFLIEAELVRNAASRPVSPDQAARLRELAEIRFSHPSEDNIDHYLTVDTAFHRLIAQLAGNKRLMGIAEQLNSEMERLASLSLILDPEWPGDDDNANLAEAIIAGDPERAVQVLKGDVDALRLDLVQRLLTNSSLRSMNVALE